MPSNGLIVIARIKLGSEEVLRERLNAIGNDINSRRRGPTQPIIDFPRSTTTHFARLCILDDPDHAHERKRLLLVTDYDGDWRAHVAELHALTSDPEAIWGCLVDYPGRERFAEFIGAHTIEPGAYYMAFRGMSLERVRNLARLRAVSGATVEDPAPSSLLTGLTRVVDDLTRLPAAGLELPELLLQRGPVRSLMAARRINETLDRVWWVWLFNRLTLNAPHPPKFRYTSAPVDATADCTPGEPGDEVVSRGVWEGVPPEDLVTQNQLTLVTVVRPEQVAQVQAVLAVIDLYARRLAAEGTLVGVSTIQTVRWALIDGGRRLLMASNYDGSWEHYIDEFAELIRSGLDALWEGSYGFPELGAQDVVALKHFLRCHQAPASVFYSAYPKTTVLNVVDALGLERRGRVHEAAVGGS